MTKSESKMICPRCGAEMNHHSEKIVYAAEQEKTVPNDPILGGFVEEFHACPRCGAVASRHA